MKKIVILFGAGAEVDFNISGGGNFALNVLGLGNGSTKKSMDSAIKDSYNKTYKKMCKPFPQEWYPSTFQIVSFEDDKLKRKLFFACYRKQKLDTQSCAQVLSDEQIEEETKEYSENERHEVIDQHTSYMGIVDGYFHTLISPKLLGPQKFCTVIACYYRAYLSIAEEILKRENACKMSYPEILGDPVLALQKMKNVVEHHSDFQKESYYSLLKKETDKSKFSIITTNYTPCCEILSGIGKDKIAFVHGRFGLFESPYDMEVIDVEKTDYSYETNLLFPYIFIQSGIKPIVEQNQISEYAKAINFFNEADRIVVVGYRINADDNHLNSLLRNAITNGKETVYLDYCNAGEDEKSNAGKDNILKRLRLPDAGNNFIYQSIDKKTNLETFEKWIK